MDQKIAPSEVRIAGCDVSEPGCYQLCWATADESSQQVTTRNVVIEKHGLYFYMRFANADYQPYNYEHAGLRCDLIDSKTGWFIKIDRQPIAMGLHRVSGDVVDNLCDDCGERHEGECEPIDSVIVRGGSGPIAPSEAKPGRYVLRWGDEADRGSNSRSVFVEHGHFWLVDPQVGMPCSLLDPKCWFESPKDSYPEVFVLGRVPRELISFIEIQDSFSDQKNLEGESATEWARSHWCLDVVATSPMTLVVHHHSLYGHVAINLKRAMDAGDLLKEPNRE